MVNSMKFIRLGVEFVGRLSIWSLLMYYLISIQAFRWQKIIILVVTVLWALLPFIDIIVINRLLRKRGA